ncbi:MAG: hypothetical protein AB7V46_04285 [Thermomicrobiales bacterium]
MAQHAGVSGGTFGVGIVGTSADDHVGGRRHAGHSRVHTKTAAPTQGGTLFRVDATQHAGAVRQSSAAGRLALVGRRRRRGRARSGLKDAITAIAGAFRVESVNDWLEGAGQVVLADASRARIAVHTFYVPGARSAGRPSGGEVIGAIRRGASAIGIVTTLGERLEVTAAASTWLARAVQRRTVGSLDGVAVPRLVAEVVPAWVLVCAMRVTDAFDAIVYSADAGKAEITVAALPVVVNAILATMFISAAVPILEVLAIAAEAEEA